MGQKIDSLTETKNWSDRN